MLFWAQSPWCIVVFMWIRISAAVLRQIGDKSWVANCRLPLSIYHRARASSSPARRGGECWRFRFLLHLDWSGKKIPHALDHHMTDSIACTQKVTRSWPISLGWKVDVLWTDLKTPAHAFRWPYAWLNCLYFVSVCSILCACLSQPIPLNWQGNER